MYKQIHEANIECDATKAVNDSESNKNYPTEKLVAQSVQNGTTGRGQNTENV